MNETAFPKDMTLRDYFAAKIIAGLIVKRGLWADDVIIAYNIAGAMLKEREKRK